MEEHDIIEKAIDTRVAFNQNATGYNCVMAIDRACGIAQVYHKYLPEEKIDDFMKKRWRLEYVDFFPAVRFGYAESGLHFMTIFYEYYGDDAVSVKEEAINKIRGLDDEVDFLEEVYCNSLYSLIDVYVEDLSKSREDVSFDMVVINSRLYNTTRCDPEDKIPSEISDVGKKYARDIAIPNANVKMDSWNLYAVKCKYPNDITIMALGKTLDLKNLAPIIPDYYESAE